MTSPKLLEFRSWAGSDRDGNPFVTPEVTTKTLKRQREVVLERYREAIKSLSDVLSQDGRRIELRKRIETSLAADRERLPKVASEAEERYPNEPYRQQLKLIRERLARVDDPRSGGYDDAAELNADLDPLAADLRTNDAETSAEAHVDPLIRWVDMFGFTLASLDLRDHQLNHTETLVEVLARQGIDYEGMSEDERVDFLTDAILADTAVVDLGGADDLNDTAARVLQRFDKLADWQGEFAVDAIDTTASAYARSPVTSSKCSSWRAGSASWTCRSTAGWTWYRCWKPRTPSPSPGVYGNAVRE